VSARDGTACGRAIRDRCSIIIEDVLTDSEFSPYRETAVEMGFRAVQSVPLISRSGALVGVLSAHFPERHRPTQYETQATQWLAELTANAIILQTALALRGGKAQQIAESLYAIETSRETLRRASDKSKK